MSAKKMENFDALVFIVVGAFGANSALAHWASPQMEPVERLVRNLTQYVKEHPNDSEGYYVLARVHSMAFVFDTKIVGAWGADDIKGKSKTLPRIPNERTQEIDLKYYPSSDLTKPENKPSRQELCQHLTASIQNFDKAIKLNPGMAHYHLGLAYIWEKGAPFARNLTKFPVTEEGNNKTDETEIKRLVEQLADPKFESREKAQSELLARMPGAQHVHRAYLEDTNFSKLAYVHVARRIDEVCRTYCLEQALVSYLRAYRLAIRKDLGITEIPIDGHDSLVGYEAGESYARLVRARGVKDEKEMKLLAEIDQDLYIIDTKPPCSAITPIIFSLKENVSLQNLLDTQAVSFDLDGDGQIEEWPWVKPTTCILVWDPKGDGQIKSGRQLFGTATWWMFFPDGYRALDSLDDDRDGRLYGEELVGLAVWSDRDTNGISDHGEVVPIQDTDLVSISTQATARIGASLMNSEGIIMQDGRRLPSYDWVVSPVKKSMARTIEKLHP